MKIPIPQIDEQQLHEAKLLINTAAELMEEDYLQNVEEVNALSRRLETLIGKQVDMMQFDHYWGHSSLDDTAKMVLMPEPEQCELRDEDITNIIIHFFEYLNEYGEAESNYVISFLAKNTGLSNIFDYIYHPSEVGLELDKSMDEQEVMRAIAAKIITDRNNSDQRQKPNAILL